ncbi:FAD-binding protein [candidate division KSB1 bacterium]|nr:FAD-binding protein [candidate division KSB1 bacterium]
MNKKTLVIDNIEFPVVRLDVVIVGSGAASLNCADALNAMGKRDIAIVTEKVGGGTSNNTGSDKQTYYKLSVSGKEPDSPYDMAKSLYDGGAMHGDLALIEATLSAQGFFHLAQIGVQFPHNAYGGYVGYKTDHDPRQRATSAGPWTSHQMVQCLLKEVKAKKIKIFDGYDVVALLVDNNRAVGLIAMDKSNINDKDFGLVFFMANDVVFGVGGPGGLYKTSVYPKVHIGAIGLALEIGAVARNLTESQYGLASTTFRWNVSGTYQQVLPRYISTNADGTDEKEFLNEYFPTMGKLATDIFLKGYQWPFDPRKIPDYGSSLIDVLVYIETVVKGRRVYMDFRRNPSGDERIGSFRFDDLEPEAYTYLKNSDALFGTPIERLQKMNPLAIELYAQNGIDIKTEPLEVAVCAQHNNGGLAGDIWWESNIKHLFPIGEVNGSHGVYRPGGSALNSGQVASLRAAQKIARGPADRAVPLSVFENAASFKGKELLSLIKQFTASMNPTNTAVGYRDEFQQRMTNYGSHIRDAEKVKAALQDAYDQIHRFETQKIASLNDLPYVLQNRHLVTAHAAYLEAIRAYLDKGGGSRGSYMVMDTNGEPVLDSLGDEWRYKPENPELRNWVLETVLDQNGIFVSIWKKRRELPDEESWFENVWGKYLQGEIFKQESDI